MTCADSFGRMVKARQVIERCRLMNAEADKGFSELRSATPSALIWFPCSLPSALYSHNQLLTLCLARHVAASQPCSLLLWG
jgi:hypothetical protein